jgi:hypothetical protein
MSGLWKDAWRLLLMRAAGSEGRMPSILLHGAHESSLRTWGRMVLAPRADDGM